MQATLIGVLVGFALGLAGWWGQQWWQRRELRQHVRTLLRLEYEHDVREARDLWERVTINHDDVSEFERLQRLAEGVQPTWQHLMWQSLAPSLAVALDDAEIRDAYAVNADLDTLLLLRAIVADAVDSATGRQLLRDLKAWKYLTKSQNVSDQERATAQRGEILGRCREFSAPLDMTWNTFCETYQRIHNPIQDKPPRWRPPQLRRSKPGK